MLQLSDTFSWVGCGIPFTSASIAPQTFLISTYGGLLDLAPTSKVAVATIRQKSQVSSHHASKGRVDQNVPTCARRTEKKSSGVSDALFLHECPDAHSDGERGSQIAEGKSLYSRSSHLRLVLAP